MTWRSLALAIDPRYLYWASGGTAGTVVGHHRRFGRGGGGGIGRVRLDGTGVNRTFIPGGGERGVAVVPRRQ